MIASNCRPGPLLALSIVTTLALQVGCEIASIPPVVDPVGTRQATSASPAELLEKITVSVAEAASTLELLEDDQRAWREQILRQKVDEGLVAIEQLLADPNADADDCSEARKAELRLLYLGVQRGWEGFDNDLETRVQETAQKRASKEELEIAQYVWLHWKYVTGDRPFAETLARITEHARQFPTSQDSLDLFLHTAAKQLTRGEADTADQCCATAISIFGNYPKLVAIRSKIGEMRVEKAKKAAAEMREYTFYQSILGKLGGFEKGYFIIYSEERDGGTWVRCDYRVLKGVRDVAKYVKRANRKDWSWEVVGKYPETKQGHQQASARCRDLIKENTITRYDFH